MSTWRQQIDQRIVEPAAIHGQPNGQFPTSILYDVHDHTGRVIGHLCQPAARAWNAMAAAAWADGIDLRATSEADTYRKLSVQQSIFTDRYRTTNQGNGSRICGGKRWYLRKGKATAACPGTSNHGRGLAVDVRDCSGPRLAWLERNAARFGFAWEVTSEAWHIHYMPGDRIPAAVLEYEARGGVTPQATTIQPGDESRSPNHNEEDEIMLIQVTAGEHKDEVWLVVGNRRRKQDATSARRLADAGIRYLMVDDIAFEQIALCTDLAGSAKG